MAAIQAIITDFDGTLVNTFLANFFAYRKAFEALSLDLSEELYSRCFGLRFDDFMAEADITDSSKRQIIREKKSFYYPSFFYLLKPNKALIELIEKSHGQGIKTAIASTARRINLMNALSYLQINDLFDLVITGNEVSSGKPNPEIYVKAMKELQVQPENTLIFEDSEVGLMAAKNSHANYVHISPIFFN